jgi:hypothetical protein
MAKKVLMAISAALVMGPAFVFAQSLPTAGAARGGQDDGVIYKQETTYDFDGDDVEGNLVRPDGENITGDQRGKTSSLINIRSDFIPEMLKSVETL